MQSLNSLPELSIGTTKTAHVASQFVHVISLYAASPNADNSIKLDPLKVISPMTWNTQGHQSNGVESDFAQKATHLLQAWLTCIVVGTLHKREITVLFVVISVSNFHCNRTSFLIHYISSVGTFLTPIFTMYYKFSYLLAQSDIVNNIFGRFMIYGAYFIHSFLYAAFAERMLKVLGKNSIIILT